MASITPLGKPLSQNSVVGANVPLSGNGIPAPTQNITAFQWWSLARATWTWILRPLWYLCFKWPTKLLIPTISDAEDDRRRREMNDRDTAEQFRKHSEAYWQKDR